MGLNKEASIYTTNNTTIAPTIPSTEGPPTAVNNPTTTGRTKKIRRRRCFKCRGTDHLRRNCPYNKRDREGSATRSHVPAGGHQPLSAPHFNRIVKKTFEDIREVILGREMMNKLDLHCGANRLRRDIYAKVSEDIRAAEEYFSCGI
jgi:hypothetical protein